MKRPPVSARKRSTPKKRALRAKSTKCPAEGDLIDCPLLVEMTRKMHKDVRALSNEELDEELRRRGLL